MRSIRLTARNVENAKRPENGRIEYWDASLRGFGLRVAGMGSKSWTKLYRMYRRLRRSTAGSYPASLAGARDRDRDGLHEVEKGTNPVALKTEQRRREMILFRAAAEFIQRHAKPTNRTWYRQGSDLKREFGSSWRHRPIASISRREIVERLDKIADKTPPVRANRSLSLIKKPFSSSTERGYVETSSADNIESLGRKRSPPTALRRTASRCSRRKSHDLRRTAASHEAQFGISPHVIERGLNHVTESLAEVARVYHRLRLRQKKHRALEMWAQYVEPVTDAPLRRSDIRLYGTAA
jgi:hypothetical protein